MNTLLDSVTHDTALPQDWWDHFHGLTGVNPSGHIVWAYPRDGWARLGGFPMAVTVFGAQQLDMFYALRRSDPDTRTPGRPAPR